MLFVYKSKNFLNVQSGTVAGNLMIKHKYQEFPSDVFVILEAIGATISLGYINILFLAKCLKHNIIASFKNVSCFTASIITKKCLGIGREKAIVDNMKPMSLTDFLKVDMKLKLIQSIELPKRIGYNFRSFKVHKSFETNGF